MASMRCSFTLDDDLMDVIDQYAKERLIDRNKAILEIIEAGLSSPGKVEVSSQKTRSFEKIQTIREEMQAMNKMVIELKNEIRLMSHILDADRKNEMKGVPFQKKTWWRIRK
ncbi:MAG: type II secretion system protein E [Methanomicrobiales archaeon]|nr:type II secretion system protein E [Methanomicrobiales archaeon]